MKKLFLAAVCAAALSALAACNTTSPVALYTPATSNVLAFQSALKPTNTTVRVGDFTAAADAKAPGCRMVGSLDVTAGKSLEQYLKDALQTDLFTAQVYDVNSPVVINGRLDEIKVNTFGTGSWTLGMQITSNRDPTGYHVTAIRTFKTSYVAEAACHNATNAFLPTVQDLMGQVVGNPGFAKLMH
jgi:predicted small lipoprotein YifL